MSSPILLRLPPELLNIITAHLCLCTDCNPSNETRNYKAYREALCALSATCRKLQAVVQPILYHRVYPYDAQVEFARTLVARPDLAACVRELHYASGAYEDRRGRPIYSRVNKCAFIEAEGPTNFMMLVRDQPGGFMWPAICEDGRGAIRGLDGLLCWHRARGAEGMNEVKLRLLERSLLLTILKLLPGLQSLVLWYQPHDLGGLPKDLPTLRVFRIYSRDIDYPNAFPGIHPFASATSQLTAFHGSFNAGLMIKGHPNVSELHLSNCRLDYEDFCTLASGFLSLRRLKYSSDPSSVGSKRRVSCRGICRALKARSGTLEDLVILLNPGWTPNLPVDRPYSTSEDFRRYYDSDDKSLSRMTTLRHVEIDDIALRDLTEDGYGQPPRDQHVLASVFPSPITSLRLPMKSWNPETLQLFENWAPICRQRCPNLQVMQCSFWQNNSSNAMPLKGLFEAAGVQAQGCLYLDDDEKLLQAHRLDNNSLFSSYDDPPGWEFWNPDVEPMTDKGG